MRDLTGGIREPNMTMNADGKLAEGLSWSRHASRLVVSVSEMMKAHLRVILKSKEVSLVKMAPGLRRATHVVVATVYNEATRIPFFFKYYKSMGFEHFIIIDNQSDDNLQQLLEDESGVSIFVANGAYRQSRFGCDWVNGILARYCSKKWILYVDADEFFVFPHCDKRAISELTEFMERDGQHSLQCLMLDMYSNKTIQHNVCGIGEDPISICYLFDRDGYIKQFDSHNWDNMDKGGHPGTNLFFGQYLGRAGSE